jgi:hypothetical protein
MTGAERQHEEQGQISTTLAPHRQISMCLPFRIRFWNKSPVQDKAGDGDGEPANPPAPQDLQTSGTMVEEGQKPV